MAYDHLHSLLPGTLREHLHLDPHIVRSRARALYCCGDNALLDRDIEHLACARITAATRQPRTYLEALQHGNPALRPPIRAKSATLRLRFDATLNCPQLAGWEVITEVIGAVRSPRARGSPSLHVSAPQRLDVGQIPP